MVIAIYIAGEDDYIELGRVFIRDGQVVVEGDPTSTRSSGTLTSPTSPTPIAGT